jgi:hypothetical protein
MPAPAAAHVLVTEDQRSSEDRLREQPLAQGLLGFIVICGNRRPVSSVAGRFDARLPRGAEVRWALSF